MDEKQRFWDVFVQSGRVQDYLRYAQCTTNNTAEEVPTHETTDRRSGDSGNPGG